MARGGAGQNSCYTKSNLCLLNKCRGKLRTNSSQQKNGKMSDDIHQSPHVLLLDFPFFADFAVFFFAAIFSYIKKRIIFKFFKKF
jgi:hypothetical protein